MGFSRCYKRNVVVEVIKRKFKKISYLHEKKIVTVFLESVLYFKYLIFANCTTVDWNQIGIIWIPLWIILEKLTILVSKNKGRKEKKPADLKWTNL